MLALPDGVSRERFLLEYWQQRPLLMRQALPPGSLPLEADELAGLACEEAFESRLIIELSLIHISEPTRQLTQSRFA